MAKQATAEKRQRRERGSINPDDIIKGAFELAEEVGIDNLSMPLLGKHLGVGVTSIYWYFRKKDDLLNAMTDRALRQYVFATPYVEAKDWRETLRNHARTMRKTFIGNPILCDLILIRSALSPRAAKLGVQEMEKAIGRAWSRPGLVRRGRVRHVLFRGVRCMFAGRWCCSGCGEEPGGRRGTGRRRGTDDIDPEMPRRCWPRVTARASHRRADDKNFEFGLECILDHASRLIDEGTTGQGSTQRRRSRPTRARGQGHRPLTQAPIGCALRNSAERTIGHSSTTDSTSMTTAPPWPPPAHIAATPMPPPRRCRLVDERGHHARTGRGDRMRPRLQPLPEKFTEFLVQPVFAGTPRSAPMRRPR